MALFAAPAQFVEADRRKGANQRETRRKGKQQRQEGVTQYCPRQDETNDRIDQAQEDGMGRNGGKIGKPARERVLEVCEADSADYRTRTDCIRAHENMQLRHCS